MAKLAIQLTSGVGSEDVRTVKKLAEAALKQGHDVTIFLMADGVYNVDQFKGLRDQGAHIAVCAHNAYERGVKDVEGILFGGQNDWAEAVSVSDMVIVLG